jgi:AbrB family looped-hinge helix DNA binding protein
MPKNNKKQSCQGPGGNGISCCRVESIISVDERGQMVLPKELRARANIKAGEKFAVTSWEKDGEVCCITLTRVDELAEMVKGTLGPLMKEIL